MQSERVLIHNDSGYRSTRRVLLTLLRLAIGVSLLAYLAKTGIIDFKALEKLFTAWSVTVAATILLLSDGALMSARLSWLFRPHGLKLRFGVSFELTLVSFFFATFLPGAAGGDLAKLFYTARANNSRRIEIMTVVLLDRAIGLFSLLILPLIFAPLFAPVIRGTPALRSLLLTAGLLAFTALAVFLLLLFSKSTANRVPGSALQRMAKNAIVQDVLGTISTYRQHCGILLASLGASLLANLFLVLVTMLGLLVVAPSSWTSRMCLVIPIGHIVNSLPLTPGGLGVGETAFNALFSITGLRGGAEALLCSRIWTALVGLIGLAFYVRGMRRKVFDDQVIDGGTCSPVLKRAQSESHNHEMPRIKNAEAAKG